MPRDERRFSDAYCAELWRFAAEHKAVVMSEPRKKGYLGEDPERSFWAFCRYILRDDPPSRGYMPGRP